MSKKHPLETYRVSQKITQAKLAEILGISAPYMSRILNGGRYPGGRIMARIERLTKGDITAVDSYPGEDA